jgi:hypothetical protein
MSERFHRAREEVRIDDPQLSPEANQLLTEELRDALGTDSAEVPADRADQVHRLPDEEHRTVATLVGENRLLVAVAFTALVVVGVIVSLATEDWWALMVAVVVHAVGTFIVASVVLRMSAEVEHVAPETAARLQDEGVGDPDRALAQLVDEYASPEQARGAAEVVSGGHNRITASPGDDRRQAAAEQRTALTPSATPTEPSGDGGMPMILPVLAVVASVVVGIGAAIATGGIAWVGAVLLIGASLAWLALMRAFARDGGGPDRAPGDAAAARRSRMLPTIAIVVAAVAAGVMILGAIAGYL